MLKNILQEELEKKFSVPIIVEHDPNCILYGYIKKNGDSKMVVRLDMSRRSARSQTVVKR